MWEIRGSRRSARPGKVVSGSRGILIAVLTGTAIAVAAAVWGVLTARSLTGTTRTDGTVRGGYASNRQRIIEFLAGDGKEYTIRTDTKSIFHTYWPGDRVPVAYDPANPADAQVADFYSTYMGSLAFGGFGLLIFALGVWGYVYMRRRKRLRDWLRNNGRELWVPVQQTRSRATHHSDGRPVAWVVETDWMDPAGQLQTAKSNMLTEDPEQSLATRGRVLVRYDPDNPAHNLIDFDSAPSG